MTRTNSDLPQKIAGGLAKAPQQLNLRKIPGLWLAVSPERGAAGPGQGNSGSVATPRRRGSIGMTPDTVQVVIYDAPAAQASSCACGCSGHGHDHHGASDDPLAGVSLEMQTKALALTLNAAFPGRVEVSYINVLTDPRGPSLPQTALLNSQAFPTPLVYHQRPGAVRRGAHPGAHPG